MSLFDTVIIKMEKLYPFENLGQILTFYALTPNRQKSINHAEPENRKSRPYYVLEVRDERGRVVDYLADPNILWHKVVYIVTDTFRKLGVRSERVRAFQICRMGTLEEREIQPHPDDLAKKWGKDPRTIYRHLSEVRDALEEKFREADLLPPKEDETPRERGSNTELRRDRTSQDEST